MQFRTSAAARRRSAALGFCPAARRPCSSSQLRSSASWAIRTREEGALIGAFILFGGPCGSCIIVVAPLKRGHSSLPGSPIGSCQLVVSRKRCALSVPFHEG